METRGTIQVYHSPSVALTATTTRIIAPSNHPRQKSPPLQIALLNSVLTVDARVKTQLVGQP
jgi:hypothetical protein